MRFTMESEYPQTHILRGKLSFRYPIEYGPYFVFTYVALFPGPAVDIHELNRASDPTLVGFYLCPCYAPLHQ